MFTTDCSDDTDDGIRLWEVVHVECLTTKDTKKGSAQNEERGSKLFAVLGLPKGAISV